MRRVRWIGCLGVLLATAAGCRCADPDAAPSSAQQPDQRSSVERPAGRCQVLPGRYTLQADRQAASSTTDDSLPFAVELGSVVADDDGFVVPHLRPGEGRTQAALLRLNADLTRGRIVELETVHGDSPVPKLASSEAGWAIALADSDASGGAYRVGWLARESLDSGEAVEPRWAAEFDELADDSPAFDLAVAYQRAVLVWDEWDRASNQSRIRVGTLAVEGEERPQERVLSPKTMDAEVPRVLPRSGGFWVAWAELQTQVEPTRPGRPAEVAVARRALRLMPLNEQAEPASEPVLVSPEGAFVQDYDLWVTEQQSVLLAWRERAESEGWREGIVHLARVNSDGSVERQVIEQGTAGSTLATLVGDRRPQANTPSLWLTTETNSGVTALAGVASDGRLLEPLEPVLELGVGSVVAALQGRLLVAEPRGRDLSLLSYRCHPASAEANGAASSAPQRLGTAPQSDAGRQPATIDGPQ